MKKQTGIVALIAVLAVIAGLTYIVLWGANSDGLYSAKQIKKGLDLAGGVSITYEVIGDEEPSQEDMDDTISKLQKRVDQYSTEAKVYQEGEDRINIEIPGISDAEQVLEELGQPGTLYFIAETDSEGNPNYEYLVDESGNYLLSEEGRLQYQLLKTIAEMKADGSIILEGTDVSSADAASYRDTMDQISYVVSLQFTQEGTTKFAEATTRAYKRNETIAIYYDGEFISVPGVDSPITEGKGQITGQNSYEECQILAEQIRIGGLKLELKELHSKVVGAQLGSEAIQSGILAGAIGFLVIAIFMIAIYYIPGAASILALMIYALLTVLFINMFEITLTLPGIAGLILSVGMAVDANVIIFSRIREELATGKSVRASIKLGFDKALSAIVDGNITTLIAAAVLWIQGSGSIKGFAQTLTLGIVLSMFTAIFVTRFILNALYGIGFSDVKWYGIAKDRVKIEITKHKKWFFIGSGSVIGLGMVAMLVYFLITGSMLNYSMEFVGGTSSTVAFSEEMSIEELEGDVTDLITSVTKDKDIQFQKIQGTTQVVIKTRTLVSDERELLKEKLYTEFGVGQENVSMESISSVISDEMKKEAVVSIAIASILMLIYIWIRFKDIRFGGSAVLALLHDVLVVLTFYAVFRFAVSSTFIACMLTIVGYSINATIVIFDRIRENLAEQLKKETLEDVVNKSVTQTISRSIFTSLTTFIMVAFLYLLGVSAIREFALPLMIGIVCGTFSSVCLTGTMWLFLRKKFEYKED